MIDHSQKRYAIVPFIGGLVCAYGGDGSGGMKVIASFEASLREAPQDKAFLDDITERSSG